MRGLRNTEKSILLVFLFLISFSIISSCYIFLYVEPEADSSNPGLTLTLQQESHFTESSEEENNLINNHLFTTDSEFPSSYLQSNENQLEKNIHPNITLQQDSNSTKTSIEANKPINEHSFTATDPENLTALLKRNDTVNDNASDYESNFKMINANFFKIRLKTLKLQQFRTVENPNILSTPFSYGYSLEQANSIFKTRKFVDCALNRYNPIVKISNSTLEVECNRYPAQYFIGNEREKEIFGKIDYKPKWILFGDRTVIDLEDKEFAMIKCSLFVKQAYLINKFSSSASNRAKNITANLIESSNSQSYKPLGVYILTLDSVSRRHFFRKLKKSVEYLNSTIVDSENFVLYDFLINNVHGGSTQANLVNMLLGKNFDIHNLELSLEHAKGNENNDEFFKGVQEKSLWKIYEKKGFVTLFSFETIYNYFNNDIGKKLYTDHAVLSFWNAATKVFNYWDFMTKQRCLGTKNASKYQLDYLSSFIKNYAGHNKFAYFHSPIAHEETATVIETLDNDLLTFFEDFFEYYKNNDEDFVLFVNADHGRVVNEWDKTLEGIIEHKLPVGFFITKQDTIKRMGEDVHSNMLHNTERLVSRLDWFLTFSQLANLPYDGLWKNTSNFSALKQQMYNQNAVSLLTERIKDNRTCEEVDISDLMCSCKKYTPISLDSSLLKEHISELVKSQLHELNEFIIDGNHCKRLESAYFLSFSVMQLKSEAEGGNQLFKLVFNVKQNPKALIEFLFYAAEQQEFRKKKFNFNNNPQQLVPFHTASGLVNYAIQVMSYKRIDNYNCGDLASRLITHNMCVCTSS
jgi:hypothetical protein